MMYQYLCKDRGEKNSEEDDESCHHHGMPELTEGNDMHRQQWADKGHQPGLTKSCFKGKS